MCRPPPKGLRVSKYHDFLWKINVVHCKNKINWVLGCTHNQLLIWICKKVWSIIAYTLSFTIPKTFTVTTPLSSKCEDEICTSKSGNLESSATPKTSELDRRGQNKLPWSVLYNVEKVLKCRCRKWPRMSHLDICSTSYGRKQGRESNWRFDFRPLKVRNRLDPGVCRWSATHR